MDSQHIEISQPLFVRIAADGTRWEFAGTTTGGCAITRAGQIVVAGPGTADTVAEMLERFFKATATRHAADLPNVPAPTTVSRVFAA